MSVRWIKRIMWVGLLLVLSVLPATVAGGRRLAAVGGRDGVWVVRGLIAALVVMGIALAVVGKRGRGWR
ncbi:MAG TPA: hypothetical protein VM008_05105 [Phycisphaerae bacterium]|nr:hypothetical protein [Phycisphaerae bacterium]